MNPTQKILVVDDRESNLIALEKVLSSIEVELVKARSGNEALKAALNHEFALAILDVQMPEMDGYELAELLRDDSRTRLLPIIFLTAVYRDEQSIYKGYAAGGIDFLTKPIHPEILLSKVRLFLELDAQRAEISSQKAKLEFANREMKAFVYSVSHDLRAPLRAMRGFSSLLLKKSQSRLDASGIDMLQRISRASDKMDHMIEDLLRLSGISRRQIDAQPVDLSAIATSVIGELREADPDREVTVFIREAIMARADPPLIEIAISNLLRNAWKFTATTDKPRIEFEVEEQNGAVVYQVRDNGAGFDRRMAAQMFMPFYRLHSEQQFSGTGIGLAIVERVVLRHGGKIWADGEPEKGAVFSFTLGV